FVVQDLTPYRGHLLHLEVSPADSGEFALALALDCESPPTVSPEKVMAPEFTLEHEFSLFERVSPKAVAEEYASIFRSYVEQLHNPFNDANPLAWSVLANFVLSHPELLGVKDFSAVDTAAKPFFEEQAQLERRIRRQSRLAPAMWDISEINDRVHI